MDLHLLRLALAHHIGQQLTPELASRIEFIACNGEDLAINPGDFEPVVVNDYVIKVERLSEILPEAKRLTDGFWSETDQSGMQGASLQVDYDALMYLERSGRLVQFTARTTEGELVGQCRMYLSKSMHLGWLMADEDTLYLAPGHRGGFLALHLVRYIMRCLVDQLGVREICANAKRSNNTGALLRRAGFACESERYVQFFPAPVARKE